MDWISYCYWRAPDNSSWEKVKHPDVNSSSVTDGSIKNLALLNESASSYVEFAKWYYEIELPLDITEQLYALSPLTDQMVKSLSSDLDFETATEFAKEIGYPVANTQA